MCVCVCRHIIHSLQERGLKKWVRSCPPLPAELLPDTLTHLRNQVALQEGAGYSLGWLTVHTLSIVSISIHTLTTVRAWQTNERKESMCFRAPPAL